MDDTSYAVFQHNACIELLHTLHKVNIEMLCLNSIHFAEQTTRFFFFFHFAIVLLRYDRPDQMGSPIFSTPPQMQRSFSSPDSLQKQALVSLFLRTSLV